MGCCQSRPEAGIKSMTTVSMAAISGLSYEASAFFSSSEKVLNKLVSVNNKCAVGHDDVMKAVDEKVKSDGNTELAAALKANWKLYPKTAINLLKAGGAGFTIKGTDLCLEGSCGSGMSDIWNAMQKFVSAFNEATATIPVTLKEIVEIVKKLAQFDVAVMKEDIKRTCGNNPLEFARQCKGLMDNINEIQRAPDVCQTLEATLTDLKNKMMDDSDEKCAAA